MKAKIIMVFDSEQYVYGVYNYNTFDEKRRVNEIALALRKERGCQTFIEEVTG